MNVSLTPDLAKFVAKKVKGGKYQTASEVVREALRLLEEREVERKAKLEALRADLQIGLDELDRGEGLSLDLKRIMADAKKLAAVRKAAKRKR